MQVLSWPAFYALELTPSCNNSCASCSNVFVRSRVDHPTSGVVWREWLREFGPYAAGIRLTGGEPTLHPDFLDILDASLSYDAGVTVFTNGRWTEPARLLEAVKRTAFAGFLVSLHGALAETHEIFTKTPGSFAETLANVKRCVAAGVAAALCMVLTRDNWREIDGLVALGKQLGVEHIAINRYLGPASHAEPLPHELRAAAQRVQALIEAGERVTFGNGFPQCFVRNNSTGCLAGVAYVSIDPWGGAHPCPRSPTAVGSLRSASLYDLWHSVEMASWRERTSGAHCLSCAALSACRGGCLVLRELRPDGDPLCGRPLKRYTPSYRAADVPGDARPRFEARIRSEDFGYALIAQGAFLPVGPAALPLLQACDGETSFDDLAERFGPAGWDLLAALWHLDMLQFD